jgi:transposase InsO family protein
MGHLNGCRYVLHDRDAQFCAEFRETLAAAGVKCLRLPPRSPNLNAFAERWVRSVKEGTENVRCGKRSPSSKSTITKNATIKARTTICSSLPLLGLSPVGDVHPLSRTSWRLTPVLQPRRMNILTIPGLHHEYRWENAA